MFVLVVFLCSLNWNVFKKKKKKSCSILLQQLFLIQTSQTQLNTNTIFLQNRGQPIRKTKLPIGFIYFLNRRRRKGTKTIKSSASKRMSHKITRMGTINIRENTCTQPKLDRSFNNNFYF